MKNNQKILYVMPTLKQDGAEVQILNLLKHISINEIEIYAFEKFKSSSSIYKDLISLGLKVHISSSFVYFFKLVSKNNYKIIHSHLPKADFFVGIVSFFNSSFLHVISVHAKYGTRKGENKLKYFIFNILWKSILNRSAGVVAISNSIESWLLDRMKIKNRNIKVIHYGINLKIREKNKIRNKNKNTIGMAARILPWKGFDKTLNVAEKLMQKEFDFKLVLAGSDDINYKKSLIKKTKDLKINKFVEFKESYQNIDDFFSEIDLFLFLSESEGFGLIVLEAIENNIPVVCSNISPLNEFVDNGNLTLVDRDNPVEIADKIIEIFNSDELYTKIQTDQRTKVENAFVINDKASQFENFYNNLLNS